MVRVISYNIEYCEGIPGKWYQYLKLWKIFFPPKNLDQRIIKTLKKLKPDILTLIEVDTGSLRSRGRDEVKFIEKEMGMRSFVEKVKYPMNGFAGLFHHVPILNKQANAIISRYKLTNIKYHVFHEGTKRMIIEATVNCPKPVTLLAAHLALGGETRAKQIDELVKIVNKIKNPVILMGDFNTFHGVEEIKKLLTKTHLKDKIALDKESVPFTEPAWHPHLRLDYILTSSDLKVNKYSILHFNFSDHLPIMIDFEFKKTKKIKKIKKK
jgi:endonuclease/exonuclease/phosphatase family metal-dependent hydrolase